MLIEQKEAEEIETKWNRFIKSFEDRVGVKGKRKLNTPSPVEMEKPAKKRRIDGIYNLISQNEERILAIEYFPEEAVHALCQDHESLSNNTDKTELNTRIFDSTPRSKKIPLKVKGKGGPSSMTVLDLRAHFKILRGN